jgi:hypothetical protein
MNPFINLSIHEVRVAVEFIHECFPDSHSSYQAEWYKRFEDRIAYNKCDSYFRGKLVKIGERWGVDVAKSFGQ